MPVMVVQGQMQQRQRSVVDFVDVEGHCKAPGQIGLRQSYPGWRRLQSLRLF
jgi:hypothetical protein